jgi:hypothetical protein
MHALPADAFSVRTEAFPSSPSPTQAWPTCRLRLITLLVQRRDGQNSTAHAQATASGLRLRPHHHRRGRRRIMELGAAEVAALEGQNTRCGNAVVGKGCAWQSISLGQLHRALTAASSVWVQRRTQNASMPSLITSRWRGTSWSCAKACRCSCSNRPTMVGSWASTHRPSRQLWLRHHHCP